MSAHRRKLICGDGQKMKNEISPVWWSYDRKYAFQKVGTVYKLYVDGNIAGEAKSFDAMCEFFRKRKERNEHK